MPTVISLVFFHEPDGNLAIESVKLGNILSKMLFLTVINKFHGQISAPKSLWDLQDGLGCKNPLSYVSVHDCPLFLIYQISFLCCPFDILRNFRNGSKVDVFCGQINSVQSQ